MRPPAKLGMTLLLASESVFFFMLIAAFVVFRSASLKTAREILNFPLACMYTCCLLASGLTAWRAARIAASRFWLVGTIVLGLVFLLGQGREYLRLLNRGVTMSQGLFGTTFFTLIGIHELHVLVGLALLVSMLWVANANVMESVATFWLFVDGVWLVIFSVLYLWTFL